MTSKKTSIITNLTIIGGFILAIVPLLYYGQNSIISPPDNLDGVVPYYKMLKENEILLALNAQTPSFQDVSTAYFTSVTYNLMTWLNVFFDVFTAHVIAYILKLFVGYLSMYLLLKKLFSEDNNHNIIKLVSFCFALLPSIPLWWLAVDSIPLLAYFFLVIKDIPQSKLDKRVFLLVLYPLLSNLPATGIFLITLWFITTIIMAFINRKINLNLFGSLCALSAGYIVVDFKAVYISLFLKEPTIRSLFATSNLNIVQSIKKSLIIFSTGESHAATLQLNLILPVIFITTCCCILYILIGLKKEKLVTNNIQKQLVDFSLISIFGIGMMLIFSGIAGLYQNKLIALIIADYFPVLRGFNWGRFSFFNRPLFYLLFTLSLVTIGNIKRLKWLPYIFVMLQLIIIFHSPTNYNYAYYNLNHSKLANTDVGISYREFFAEDLFNEIKADLNYNGEKVAAVGYHPGVLMYNGFATVDGYMSMNTLQYKQGFRKIIAPELDTNEVIRNYFDTWGGRLYLYNDDVPYMPTRTKVSKRITLRINTVAFAELGGKYILSRAEIENAEDLGLDFVRDYANSDSIYEIFVYKMK